MIKQNAGFKHKLSKEAVDALFKPCPVCAARAHLHVQRGRPLGCRCADQGDLLTALYRLAVPDFDRFEKLPGYPVVNLATGDYLMRAWVRRDQRLSPDVMAGGAWMNSGFSSRERVEVTGTLLDFEVWLPESMVMSAPTPSEVEPTQSAVTIVPEPLNQLPVTMTTNPQGQIEAVVIGHGLSPVLADQLQELFRMQRLLNQRIGVNTDSMTEEEKTKWLLNYTRAMQQEMAELTDSVPWKWWAKYQKFDEQNARVEVVDLFHFLISMAQVLGMSADDVFAVYVKKNAVNFQRQESGYTQKDANDSKHI